MTSAFSKFSQVEAARSTACLAAPHFMESEVSRRIQQHPQLSVQSLTVHRIPNGVCLEGRIISTSATLNLQEIVRGIPGLEEVVNHLIVCLPASEDCDAVSRREATLSHPTEN